MVKSINSIARVIHSISDTMAGLGIEKATYILDDITHGGQTLASVKVDGITLDSTEEERKDEMYKFIFKFEPIITIYCNHIDSFIDDLCKDLDKCNGAIRKYLKMACLENAIVHEMRHLYQFINNKLIEDDVDIIVNDEKRSYGFKLTPETTYEFECDANEFMISKIEKTTLKDKKIKQYLSKLEYNNILLSLNKEYESVSKEINSINSDEFVEKLSIYTNNIRYWYNRLNKHIKNNY